MILIDINHLSVAIEGREIFSDATFTVQKGECVGLTGQNGAGKTTLMRVILGRQEYTGGTVSVAKGCRLGYLEQQHQAGGGHTVLEEAQKSFEPLFAAEEKMRRLEQQMALGEDLEALGEKYQRAADEYEALGGYGWCSQLHGVLKGLGLGEIFWDKPVDTLSGGEKTRLALARLLLENNDVLLLDEPTNHLDLEAAQWLTDYLARFDGTVLLISHDRYMMDKLCTGVAQIENGRLRFFKGNYTDYCRKWEEELRITQNQFDRQQEEIRRQRAIIARFRQFNREKSIRAAESREKALARMELIEAPRQHEDMRLHFTCNRTSGGDVFLIRNLSKSFGQKTLFQNFDAEIRQGQKIVIIGPNGAGKTTLLSMLTGQQVPDKGEILRGINVDIGYYEQGHKAFMGDETVMDMVWAGNRKLNQTQVRSRCAAMLFFGEDVFKPGKVLSGGERARCALCRLSLSGSNTLLLDEPTNHLDMDSREVLEDALERFEGTLIAVSHDRYFINRIADTIWVVKDGRIEVFSGSYDAYLAGIRNRETAPEEKAVNKTRAAKERIKERADREEEKRKKSRVRELEKEIAALEAQKTALEALFASAGIYEEPQKLLKTQKEYREAEEKLDKAMEEWMELNA